MLFANRKILVFGAAIGLVVALLKFTAGRKRNHAEVILDDALGDTFPASDPTATQDYAIPVNR